jgi:nucleotide-binding universal stress UspA family protein
MVFPERPEGLMLEHILLALDDSDDAAVLLPLLHGIARAAGSQVAVLQSVPFLWTLVEMPGELAPGRTGDAEPADGFVDALAAFLRSERIPAEGFTNVGRSALMIAAAAERTGASLILTRLHRPSRLDALLRISPVPVLAVPDGAGRGSSRILVPIEDAASLEALPYAALLARWLGSDITFVAAGGQPLLPAARDLARREGIATEVSVLADDLTDTLLGLSAALIVLNSSPRMTVTRLVRESTAPLLLVRRPLLRDEPRPSPPILLPPARHSWRRTRNPVEGIGQP